jgi:formate/nitrite transporter FocA (FNT family)
MVSKKYFFVSSVLFTIIFLVYILIVISGWTHQIENFVVPEWISFIILLVSGYMSYKSFVYWRNE